jgi:hypothetical protein
VYRILERDVNKARSEDRESHSWLSLSERSTNPEHNVKQSKARATQRNAEQALKGLFSGLRELGTREAKPCSLLGHLKRQILYNH